MDRECPHMPCAGGLASTLYPGVFVGRCPLRPDRGSSMFGRWAWGSVTWPLAAPVLSATWPLALPVRSRLSPRPNMGARSYPNMGAQRANGRHRYAP